MWVTAQISGAVRLQLVQRWAMLLRGSVQVTDLGWDLGSA